ncbi:MAG: hypothetical protein HKP03_10825 [Xanthomonadales bacterium]|nr:hypothetical protein [Gammaproteobacteria bacterium]MBT8063603.1 hypothetical protein [Gammaproteobacteria bacterium]NNK33802.1 hypothetical protein [Xanthomonadales bacterium]NNK38963.1 hypothetical protein [Xanthomonadales bacterium]
MTLIPIAALRTGISRAHPGLFALLLLTALLSACSSNQVEKSRSEAFKQYETIIRWSQWDAAADFIAPEYLEENPISRLDMDRLRLFRVTTYTIRSTGVYDEGMTARQVVEIKMFNTHQATERTIIDEQEWRYDAERERWLLHSGLPDPTKRY